MKNMIKTGILTFVALSALVLTSCGGSTEYTKQTCSAKSTDPKAMTFLSAVTADLEVVGEKINYTEEFKVSDYVGMTVEKFRALATHNAAEKSNADVIVAPNYETIENVSKNTVTVTITGYPAKYKDFRVATDSDVKLAREASKVLTKGVEWKAEVEFTKEK